MSHAAQAMHIFPDCQCIVPGQNFEAVKPFIFGEHEPAVDADSFLFANGAHHYGSAIHVIVSSDIALDWLSGLVSVPLWKQVVRLVGLRYQAAGCQHFGAGPLILQPDHRKPT